MLPTISVIVPVYNVEKYLPKCVESIVNQTYKNLEIILVDDGSTDKSGEICDGYSLKDCRIKVIHKKNGGLSDARNVGLDICTGEYIGFVDSDDYIDKDMYRALYKFSEKNNLDVVMCGSYYVLENNILKSKSFEPKVLDQKKEIIKEIFINKYGGVSVSVCNKLYKNTVLEGLKFEYGKTSEDVFFVLKWIEKTKCFGRISDNKYFYIQRKNSITNQRKFSNKLLDVVDGYSKNLEIIRKRFPEIVEVGEYRLWWAYKIIIERIMKCADYADHQDILKEIQKDLRHNWIKILGNQYFNMKNKIAYVLLMIDIDIYQYLKDKKNIFMMKDNI
ncbi:MAG: glycosyltransferase [Acidaminococcaceae bacterium]|nr:glycosyltransferase [Acidaminococcaceae bacterium]